LVLNDGYCINIKQQDPATSTKINKNVSSKDYYAYRLMIRCNQDNVILRGRELSQQFMVDMYVKIESEQLRYLRFNQKKLRTEGSQINKDIKFVTRRLGVIQIY
jgi:hypothetical protein